MSCPLRVTLWFNFVKDVCVVAHSSSGFDTLLEFLFDADESLNTVNHFLDKLDFGEADALLVGDVPLATWTCRSVFSSATSGLDAEALSEVFELVRSECVGEERQHDHC